MIKNRIIQFTAYLMIVFFAQGGTPAIGNTQEAIPSANPKKINITSDTLIFNNEGRFAEFLGQVRAEEENSVLTADKVKIFFSAGAKPEESAVINDQSIKKILATGNVEIKFDNNLAVSDQAEYSLEDNLLILTGDNTKVKNGENYITGEKIIINRLTGSVTVKGSENKRVEAEFFSKDTDAALNGKTPLSTLKN